MDEEQAYRFNCDPIAAEALLDIWEENIDALRDIRKIRIYTYILVHMYKGMAEMLKDFGSSHVEVKRKIDNLSRKCELAKVGDSGGSPSTWKHFDRLASILQASKAIDFVAVDSTDFSPCTNEEHFLEESSTRRGQPSAKRRKIHFEDKLLRIEREKSESLRKLTEDAGTFQMFMMEWFSRQQ